MDKLRLRRGPDPKKYIDLEATRDSIAVLFRAKTAGNRTALSRLQMPYVLGRNIKSRNMACPTGLSLFRVAQDQGFSSKPGTGDDPVVMMRDSAMSYIRSRVRDPKGPVAACFHTYRRAGQTETRAEELIPSGKLFLEFNRLVPEEEQQRLFAHFKLVVHRALVYWDGSFVVAVTQATGCSPVKMAAKLQELTFKHRSKEHFVFDYADPIFHRERSLPTIPSSHIFDYQWHLQNHGLGGGTTRVDIRAPEAWDITKGHPNVRIAVIDDAFDLSSESFSPSQVISPLNIHTGGSDVSPAGGEWHGTSVLGLTSSAHGEFGCCGIAPDCPFIPIKLDPLVDDDAEARAFDHAVNTGALVINCSWGPYDNYSQEVWQIPRLTELAIENAYRNGVAVVFAAGNGSENMKTDQYASHPCVIAVAATTDTDMRAVYSDYGDRVWVCAPSSGGQGGIVTTDVINGGYNIFGSMTTDFGGTSAAAPIVAGVLALMQSAFRAANPNEEHLTVEEIRAILRENVHQEIEGHKQQIRDYWTNALIPAKPKGKEGHSYAFGYGRIDAFACVQAAAKWKRNKSTTARLRKLRNGTGSVRREPKIPRKRPGKPGSVSLDLPRHRVGDPLSQFHFEREKGMAADFKTKFNAGEHVWLGDKGFKLAFAAFGELPPPTIRRGEGSGGEMFSYGEIVALSGDFYQDPPDLFYEKPAWYAWLYESNDVSDLKRYMKEEIAAIKKQITGSSIEYPDFNIQFAWNAKDYMELAKDNQDHFGWHNMRRYCECHEWALDLARSAGVATGQEADNLWRKSLFYNGFADHFLTDAFAAGHLRVPRKQIMDWDKKSDLSPIPKIQEAKTGFLSKLLHDQDGHRNTDHSAGETRPEKDGLHVTNSNGQSWWTRCDGQLFINADESSASVTMPIAAVKESVWELLEAKKNGKVPTGVFQATRLVPFPHPDETRFTAKFSPTANTKIKKWVQSASFYEIGINEDNVKKLFSDLPDLMGKFRESIQGDIEKNEPWIRRLPKPYKEAFKNVDKGPVDKKN